MSLQYFCLQFVAIIDYNKAKGEETVQEFANQFGKDRVRFFLCDVAKDDELGGKTSNGFHAQCVKKNKKRGITFPYSLGCDALSYRNNFILFTMINKES